MNLFIGKYSNSMLREWLKNNHSMVDLHNYFKFINTIKCHLKCERSVDINKELEKESAKCQHLNN